MRETTEQDRNGLKTAFKQLISAVGGYDASVASSRYSRTQLHRCGDIDQPEYLPPLDVVLDLELIAGKPIVTQALAGRQGYALMPTVLGEGDLAQMLQDLGRDAGDTMADSLKALSGGMATADMERVRSDLQEIVRVAMLAHARIQDQLRGPRA